MSASPLSPKARAILDETRDGLLPAPDDRQRIGMLLTARLAAGTPPTGAAGSRPFLRANAGRMAWGLVVAGGLAGFALIRPTAPVSTAGAPAVTDAAVVQHVASTDAVTPPEPPAAGPPAIASVAPPPRRTLPATRPRNRLGEEVALLSQATSALRAGRTGEALTSLAEHQRRFPSGLLAVERHTMRAQALCALQRINEGRAELAQLAPQSPAAARAEQLCDAAATRAR